MPELKFVILKSTFFNYNIDMIRTLNGDKTFIIPK